MRLPQWYTSPLAYKTVRELSQTLGTSEILASVLVRRGYDTPAAAGRFLSPVTELHNPFLFPEMERVRDRLLQAAAAGEKVCVHGDYDVDGITATALMVSVLKEIGVDVSWHLPNRFSEGYGIAPAAIEKIGASGAGLLVTVDCGISARQAIERAAELGMDTIVIDHHRPSDDGLPPAAIISPLLCDYPFKELAGVGLAFKVAQALFPEDGSGGGHLHPVLKRQLDLVALGTIADVVPVLDENRSLIRRGLVQMSRTRRPGLKELMRVGLVEPARVSAGLVAFRLAPRINAAGRLDDPEIALQLLLAEDGKEAAGLADRLDLLNRERQKLENKMVAEAEELLGRLSDTERNRRGYVLSSPGWHEGVIGIVASRLVEAYNRPVIVIAEGDSCGKGSGRSIPAFNLHGSLQELNDLLVTFGGHKAACGLTIDLERIPDFTSGFAAHADSILSPDDLTPRFFVDALVCGGELTLELAEELTRLEPFGLGNPSVSLMAAGSRILAGRATKDGRHLQCQVDAGGARSSAIGFGQAFLVDKLTVSDSWDVAFRLERNEWNGSVAPQLNLREIFPQSSGPGRPAGLCPGHCDIGCSERVREDEFWSMFLDGAPLPAAWGPGRAQAAPSPAAPQFESEYLAAAGSVPERLSDRRGRGHIHGQVAQLMATGENILLLVADVARRRRGLLSGLPVENSGVKRVILAGSRCASAAPAQRFEEAAALGKPILGITDFATATIQPGIMSGFNHLVFIDPPFSAAVFEAIAGAAADAYVHLLHCGDEVQFTKRVLEHEYSLRAPLIKVYKHLIAGKTYPLDETTERQLLAGGKHLRQPATVARCLRILRELELITVEDREGKPMMTLRETEKADLDSSATYRENQVFYEECLKFLSKSLNAKATPKP